MRAYIKAVASYLPKKVVVNEVNRITKKIGIHSRHVVEDNECASDLAYHAAEKLFSESSIDRNSVDFVIFCTQSPDFLLPTTACILQSRLGLPRHCGAFDFNLGCSGFIYGLSIAKGLIETGQAARVLLLTAETYSKYVHPEDNTVYPIFGDAGAATLISAEDTDVDGLYAFQFGTDGAGAKHLIVPAGASRHPAVLTPVVEKVDKYSNRRTNYHLYMNGSAIIDFAEQVVPDTVDQILTKANLSREQVDYFIFHQANKFVLKHLQQKCDLQGAHFWNHVETVGNTVSCTIPLAITSLVQETAPTQLPVVMFVGFGVGLSWAGCMANLSRLSVTSPVRLRQKGSYGDGGVEHEQSRMV